MTSAPPSALRRCWRLCIRRDLRVSALLALRFKLGVLRLEGVGDVLQKDQAEDNVLVLRHVHIVAEAVGHLPQLGLEAEIGTGLRLRICFPLVCH